MSLPYGWGHDRPGARLRTAAEEPGVSINALTDEQEVDPLSGTAVFNGVAVELRPVTGTGVAGRGAAGRPGHGIRPAANTSGGIKNP